MRVFAVGWETRMPVHDRIEVLVCHSNPVLQAGLMVTLTRHEDLDCREGGEPEARLGSAAGPEVIVADHASGIRWVGAMGSTRSSRARPRVLIVTHTDRECDIRAALTAGVQGYLLLDDASARLAPAIRALRRGERVLSPRVASRMAENLGAEPLTRREEDVLRLVVEGRGNQSIADGLGVGLETVKTHLRSAFVKLGAGSRTQAVATARRRGLLRFDSADAS